ncbi:MAG: stalk domain-containing protein [Tumebacillaceae bacterium]
MFSSYTLQEIDGSWQVTLYVEHEQEFAREMGQLDSPEEEAECQQKFGDAVRRFVSENLPNLVGRNLTVKIMAGAVMIGSLSLVPTGVKAAGSISQEAKTEAQNEAGAESFNMGYLFLGTSKNFISDVDNAHGVPSVVAPSFFELDSQGNLALTWQFDPAFVDQMHQRGIRVIPYLTNNWDRNLGRQALQNRAFLAKQIADAVEKYNFDGVNIDLEHLTEADRDAHTDLIRLLKSMMPSDKELSVAVAANPYGWQTGWVGSYDYAALAQQADYLFLMSYDESSEGDIVPGPVAGYDFVEKSIQYALAQGVPKEKLVMGLPFYGRYWQQGELIGGHGITDKQIQAMLERYQSTVVKDPGSQSMKATVTIKEGDPTSVVGGRTLGPGVYTIWYDNEETIAKKVGLVGKYGIKGTGEWSIGQETPDIWDAVGKGSSVESTGAAVPLGTSASPPVTSGYQRKNPQGIGVILNGVELEFADQRPAFVNSRTMVPLRKVFESMGAVVGYDNNTKIITITKGGVKVVLKQGSKTATVNGKSVVLDQSAIVLGGRTMVPLRFISEALGAKVDWDQATSTAFLTYDGQAPPPPAGVPAPPPPPPTDDMAASHQLIRNQIVADAQKYLGVPYKWGGTSPTTGFDCSGFVNFMFTTHGVTGIPRTTSGDLYNRGPKVSKDKLLPGDLVYFAINQPGVISHVGFYIGNNQFISATSSKGIAIATMDNPYWAPHYVGANRVY